MSDFFQRLKVQESIDERTYLHKIAFGAAVGILAVNAFLSHVIETSSLTPYFEPDAGAALLGAASAAIIIKHHDS